jgi:hypothetical protein
VDESANAADVSPLQAEREWIQQAEDNVLDRLFTAGLIDAPSDFDKTLAALANNILAYNNILPRGRSRCVPCSPSRWSRWPSATPSCSPRA